MPHHCMYDVNHLIYNFFGKSKCLKSMAVYIKKTIPKDLFVGVQEKKISIFSSNIHKCYIDYLRPMSLMHCNLRAWGFLPIGRIM